VKKRYKTPFKNRLARVIIRPIFRGLFHILGRIEIIGLENVPREGAYLIAINHISIYEAPFVVAFWPVAPEVAGASIIWNRPGQSLLARMYGGIPVHRGQYDRRMIDSTVNALQSGYPLLIAPEGGRSHTPGMRKANPGVAFLMDKARVPVIPVGVIGTTEDYFEKAIRGRRPIIRMRIGEPIVLPPLEGKGTSRRELRQRNADLVMFRIAALLPPEYRGVYADHDIQSESMT
jgi:1-acyl-sn-glycerol-3-phosphate acyltransferase